MGTGWYAYHKDAADTDAIEADSPEDQAGLAAPPAGGPVTRDAFSSFEEMPTAELIRLRTTCASPSR
jgi:hypothetical protein